VRQNGDSRGSAAPLPVAVILCHGPTAGLNVVRALHRYGVASIAVLFEDPLVSLSHLPQRKIPVPGRSHEEKEANLRNILLNMNAGDRPVLLPTSDRLLDFICAYRPELEGKFSLLMPSSELVRTLNDKAEETALVAGLGFPLPKTVAPLPVCAGELEERLALPMMIKLRKHEFWSVLDRKNVIVRTHEELCRFYAKKSAFTHELIAQELIEGSDDASWICSAAFDRRHQLASAAMKRKLRMAPPHFGDATVAISATNPELLDIVERMGRAMGCVGIAGFEFRWDRRDGQYKYIEMNPRLGSRCSSVEYDYDLGVPTAYTAYRLALDLPVSPMAGQRNGIVYREFDTDLLNRFRDHESLGSILRHHAALSWQHQVHEQYASLTDPLPALRAWTRTLEKAVRKAGSRVRSLVPPYARPIASPAGVTIPVKR